ncbi:hypothetical protein [Novosphingobium sp. KACC 22771]|uniref:hypothetical protein n=1 Tax=Novosphingobium sp. KACC 22771 TaxID=3025670 RepID=UPI002365708D|nr:hypothetical protein [Novosphingobium sp. KACC 22771]WDF74676.1 hypothetical protein PQ467_22325 [Novosphingobium sp. KACC 22771]
MLFLNPARQILVKDTDAVDCGDDSALSGAIGGRIAAYAIGYSIALGACFAMAANGQKKGEYRRKLTQIEQDISIRLAQNRRASSTWPVKALR